MSLHYINEEGNLTNKNNKRRRKSESLLKKYGITNILISEWFNYHTPASFNSSKAKQEMIEGVKQVIKHIETHK
jgi:hypothetical protein